jgi:hypothetical protein
MKDEPVRQEQKCLKKNYAKNWPDSQIESPLSMMTAADGGTRINFAGAGSRGAASHPFAEDGARNSVVSSRGEKQQQEQTQILRLRSGIQGTDPLPLSRA